MNKQWSITNRYFVLSLGLAGGLWFIIAAKDLMAALLIAALFAYVLEPIVTLVHKRVKMPRKLTVPLVYIATIATLVTIVVLILPLLPEGTISVMEEFSIINDQIEEFLKVPVTVLGFTIPLQDMMAEFRLAFTEAVNVNLIVDYAQNISHNLAWVLIIFVTTYYLLLDWNKLRDWLLSLTPPTHQSDARRLYDDVRNVWGRYLRGQLSLMFIIGIMTWVGLTIIGLPGAAAIGVLAGMLDVILSVGPAIAMLVASVVALISGSIYLSISNGVMVALVLAIFGGIQMAENIWLRPRVLGNSLHLHPAIVFIAVIGSLTMAGILVALIIIPVLGSLVILGRYLYAKVIGIDPWTERSAQTLIDKPKE